MSTATYDRPLRAVPAPPEQRERFALLLAIRRRAEQSLNLLLALPRGAAGWALRHLRALTDAARNHRVLGWVGRRLQGAVALAREVGVVSLIASVLSTPAVWRATMRAARLVGSAMATTGRCLWSHTQELLSRGGSTGQLIEHTLSRAGSALTAAAWAVAAHPAAPVVVRAAKAALRLVRPISQTVVAHRLLGLLIPLQSIRVAVELMVVPVVLALGLPERTWAADQTTAAPTLRPHQEAKPTTHAEDSSAPAGAEQPGGEDSSGLPASADVARNRAERRAQQQEQARAKRAQAHR